ncbi:hypothetical protein [Streptomyces uncialis]|uniref:hypothetical protein n=1 Tax=Streptomyces uncialis TaxID=1048205 RepID=UPI0033DD0CB2
MTDTPDTPHPAADLRTRMTQHIDAALALLDDIPDPVAREAAGRLLADDLLPAAAQRVKALRGAAVRDLRAQGLTLKTIAAQTGLSVPRIDQLAKDK